MISTPKDIKIVVMKLCKYCNKYYKESDFGIAATTPKKTYRRLKCRYCYYKTKRLLIEKYQKYLNNYKEDRGCFKCGNKDHRVLEFHHLRDKKFTIGYAYYCHFGMERVKEEIKKCAVICANCHKIVHYKQPWAHGKGYK
ncbi:MAG: hypothetical protein NT148_00530 [Candidatus Nealsonbacteria bacterium]|nr:hypothetical protein [Candidatus Nealsonbacteria bacterium]